MSQTPFNPQEHLSIVDGAAYLEVKWRLVWFREQYPTGSIWTHVEKVTEDGVIVSAKVDVPKPDDAHNTYSGSGIGYARWDSPYSAPETAETKAIGRALAVVGFGTQFAGHELAEGSDLADSPIRMPQQGQGRQKGTETVDHTGSASSSRSGNPGASGPPPWEDSVPVSDAEYMAGQGEPPARRTIEDITPRTRTGHALEPTDRQYKLVDVLRQQLNLADAELDEIAKEHGGQGMATIDRRGVSALITELQRLKQERHDASRIG